MGRQQSGCRTELVIGIDDGFMFKATDVFELISANGQVNVTKKLSKQIRSSVELGTPTDFEFRFILPHAPTLSTGEDQTS
jgi:hypothetical protein